MWDLSELFLQVPLNLKLFLNKRTSGQMRDRRHGASQRLVGRLEVSGHPSEAQSSTDVGHKPGRGMIPQAAGGMWKEVGERTRALLGDRWWSRREGSGWEATQAGHRHIFWRTDRPWRFSGVCGSREQEPTLGYSSAGWTALERQEPSFLEFVGLPQHRADRGLWAGYLERRPRRGHSHHLPRTAPPRGGLDRPACPESEVPPPTPRGRLKLLWHAPGGTNRSPEPRVYIKYIRVRPPAAVATETGAHGHMGMWLWKKNIYKMAFPNV